MSYGGYEWQLRMFCSAVLVALAATHGFWLTLLAGVLVHMVRIGYETFTPITYSGDEEWS